MGQVVATNDSVSVPAGNLGDCVKTKNCSLLEPGHENKRSARGVGCVKTIATDGTTEELISITKP